jgi:Outer membrane protein (porin)
MSLLPLSIHLGITQGQPNPHKKNEGSMMKQLTVVAIAVLVATQANATEVYKNEKVNLDLNGRAYAGEFLGSKDNGTEKSEKVGGNNYIRLGAKGEAAITGTQKAIGVYEAQYKSQSSENDATGISTTTTTVNGTTVVKSVSSSNNITTRLAYGGVKDDTFGTVTFGRQLGAVGTMAAWTDVALTDSYGNDGLGIKADQYGTYRSNDVLKYSGVFNNVQIDVDYKFGTGTVDPNSTVATSTSETASNEAAYGTAISYNHPSGFSAGIGYNDAVRQTNGLNDAKLWIAGVKFDDKSWYAALNYDKGSDFFYSGTTPVDMTGTEAAFGYNFANGFGLMSTYNRMKQEVSGGEDVNAVDYYTLGAQYKFNKNLRVMAEYRINNKDNGVAASATGYTASYATTNSSYRDYKNDMQLAVRYDF